MHIEVQVALNFVISYLYNKLPRRRVNIFGEELEKALKDKFQGHWYPDKPFKGSGFRCIKTGEPVDRVLERAARESGMSILDILENLPQDLAVWVDPGEVSYRIGEKGAVKILFSDKGDPQEENNADREVTKTFNPEAQCFRPIESLSSSLSSLSLSPKSLTPFGAAQNSIGGAAIVTPATAVAPLPQQQNGNQTLGGAQNGIGHLSSPSSAPSPNNSYKGSPSPIPAFIPRTTTPLTFTTATFAQTKFGSTKLKTSSKRANRMSPTEFSNYIKQRAAMQQQLHQQGPPHPHSPAGRALSPDPSAYYFHQGHHYPTAHHQFPAPRSIFESSNQFLSPDLYSSATTGGGAGGGAGGKVPYENNPLGPYYNPNNGGPGPVGSHPSAPNTPQDNNGKLGDNNNWPYPGQYQHLLVAN